MKSSTLKTLLCGLLLSIAASAHADIDSALKLYDNKKYDAAYAEFSKLATLGDNRAKSFLTLMTLRGQGTPRDVNQGAKLARECAEGGEPTCYAIYAELNLPGNGLPVNFPEARTWTRKAIAGGDQRAGLLLWQAYALDPANMYIVNGKADNARYNQLAHRSVTQRADQIEAIDALAAAAAAGYVPARMMLATVLIDQSGTSNVKQIRALLEGIPDLPANFGKYLALAQQVETLGPTRASPKVIADSVPTILAGATGAAVRAGVADPAQCQDFRMMSIQNVSEILNVSWLPLKHPLVANTYPLTGSWQEDWHVFFCGEERVLPITLTVDGMGGAYYTVRPRR